MTKAHKYLIWQFYDIPRKKFTTDTNTTMVTLVDFLEKHEDGFVRY